MLKDTYVHVEDVRQDKNEYNQIPWQKSQRKLGKAF
jgi:hypothetical protein